MNRQITSVGGGGPEGAVILNSEQPKSKRLGRILYITETPLDYPQVPKKYFYLHEHTCIHKHAYTHAPFHKFVLQITKNVKISFSVFMYIFLTLKESSHRGTMVRAVGCGVRGPEFNPCHCQFFLIFFLSLFHCFLFLSNLLCTFINQLSFLYLKNYINKFIYNFFLLFFMNSVWPY